MFGDDPYEFSSDPRVSAAHFAEGSLRADVTSSSPDGGTAGVTVCEGLLPDRTDAQMTKASKGAVARCARMTAVAERHQRALLGSRVALAVSRTIKMRQRLRIKQLEKELSNRKSEKKAAVEKASAETKVRADSTILEGKSETACRSLCGVKSSEGLKVSA